MRTTATIPQYKMCNPKSLAEEILPEGYTQKEKSLAVERIKLLQEAGYSKEEIEDIVPRTFAFDQSRLEKTGNNWRGVNVENLPEDFQKENWQ